MTQQPKSNAALMAAALAAAASAQDEGLDLAQLQQFMLHQLARTTPRSSSNTNSEAATKSAPVVSAVPNAAAAVTAGSIQQLLAALRQDVGDTSASTATSSSLQAAEDSTGTLTALSTNARTAAAADTVAAAAKDRSRRPSQAAQLVEQRAATEQLKQPQKDLAVGSISRTSVGQASLEAFKHKHLREVDAGLAVVVDCADGSSAAPVSAALWTDLHLKEELLMGVELQGFSKPSKIQAAALPLILGRDENLIAQAQNGSGKTATFALAMLTKVDNSLKAPQALCLCPTRELAQQTVRVVEALARFTDTSIFIAIPQKADSSSDAIVCQGKCKVYTTLSSPAVQSPLVVGTPGKCMELLKKRKFPPENVRLFVLDEADELINFSNNMAPQVQQIRRAFPQRLQILLFSATFSEEVRGFAEKLMPTANKITVKKEELTLSCIRQFYIICDKKQTALEQQKLQGGLPYRLEATFFQKFAVLSSLYASMCIGQSVIFVNSRRSAFALALKMQEEGYAVSLICGTQAQGPEKMGIEMRDRIMEEFRRGETKVLICTDVLARGIDVPQVTLVVNFDLPLVYQGRVSAAGAAVSPRESAQFNNRDNSGIRYDSEPAASRICNSSSGMLSAGSWEGGASAIATHTGVRVNMETYIHRIGRTGRFGLKGIAINLITSQEENLLQQIRNFYKCDIEPLDDDPEEVEQMIKNLRI